MIRTIPSRNVFLPLFSVICGMCWGDPPTPNDPLKRNSPQSAVVTFLEASKARDYPRAVHYLDLRSRHGAASLASETALAEQLEQILVRDSQFDVAALSADPNSGHTEGLPSNRERVASFQLNGKTVDLQLERIELRSGAFVWKFTRDSVALIPQLAKASSQSVLERHMPDVLINLRLFGLAAWEWLALIVLVAAVAGITKLIGWLLPLILVPLLSRIAPKMGGPALEAATGPAELLMAAAMFRAGLEWIDPPAELRLYLMRALAFFTIVGIGWLFIGVLDLGIARVRGYLGSTHPRFSGSVLPLLSRIVKVGAFAFGVIAVLGSWGYNTNTILAGLGIGGIAIALAAQKTIENLFGGVAVVSDQPVFVGDFCKFGDTVGTVEDIGLRSTRIRTLDRTLVTIPNAQFSSMSLENFSRRDKLLFHQKLNLRRDTVPAQVRAVLTAINRILAEDQRIETAKLPVRFVGVGSYSLDIEVFAYILTGDGDEFLSVQQELLLKILDAVAAAGTALALPTQASVSYSVPAPEVAAGNGWNRS
jgi:MscS family membrane protein